MTGSTSICSGRRSPLCVVWTPLLLTIGCGRTGDPPCAAPLSLVDGACVELEAVRVFMPFLAGTSARISQGSGTGFTHQGRECYAVDFAVPEGTEVAAVKDGRVTEVKDDSDTACLAPECTAFANDVTIDHQDGTSARYLHLMQHGALVAVAQWVCHGQRVGLSGNTGRTTGPHLHLEVDDGDGQSLPLELVELGGASLASFVPWPIVTSQNVPPAECLAP